MTIRVVIADDQHLVRSGLRMILATEADIEVVADVGDGRAAVEAVRRLRPDIALMDIRMPVVDGLAATRMITAEPAAAATRVVMLTTYDLDEYLFESLQAGAVGFLLKGESPENLIRGVRTVAAGDCLLDPSATRKLIAQFVASRPAVSKSRDRRDGDASPTEAAARQQVARLTGREKEVLQLMALGRSNSEIAEELFVGDNTVKTHVSHVLSKLTARDRIQAVIVAYQAGVAEPTQSRRPR